MNILRTLRPCISFQSGTTHILYASGRGPLRRMTGSNMTEVEVGLQRVQLLKSQLPDPAYPADTQIFTMKVKNVSNEAIESILPVPNP